MCEYCEYDKTIFPIVTNVSECNGTDPTLYLIESHLFVYDERSGEDMAEFSINFCPMCGRDLKRGE